MVSSLHGAALHFRFGSWPLPPPEEERVTSRRKGQPPPNPQMEMKCQHSRPSSLSPTGPPTGDTVANLNWPTLAKPAPKGGAPKCGAPKCGPRRVGPRRVGPRRVGQRRVWPRRVGPRRVGGPKFRFFFPFPPPFRSFCVSLGVFSGNFGGVLKRRVPEMCTFGVLGLSSSPGGPVWWGRLGFTRQPKPKRAHFMVPAFKNTTKIQRKGPKREKKRMKIVAGVKKKSEILGGPAEGGPAEGGPAEGGPAEGGPAEGVRRRGVRRRGPGGGGWST